MEKLKANHDIKFSPTMVRESETSLSPHSLTSGPDCSGELSAGTKDYDAQSEMAVQKRETKRKSHSSVIFVDIVVVIKVI